MKQQPLWSKFGWNKKREKNLEYSKYIKSKSLKCNFWRVIYKILKMNHVLYKGVQTERWEGNEASPVAQSAQGTACRSKWISGKERSQAAAGVMHILWHKHSTESPCFQCWWEWTSRASLSTLRAAPRHQSSPGKSKLLSPCTKARGEFAERFYAAQQNVAWRSINQPLNVSTKGKNKTQKENGFLWLFGWRVFLSSSFSLFME